MKAEDLKTQIARAHAAWVDGLVCGVCGGDGRVELDQPWEHYEETCPACDGTGYPRSDEVLTWALAKMAEHEAVTAFCDSAVTVLVRAYLRKEPQDGAIAEILCMALDMMGVAK